MLSFNSIRLYALNVRAYVVELRPSTAPFALLRAQVQYARPSGVVATGAQAVPLEREQEEWYAIFLPSIPGVWGVRSAWKRLPGVPRSRERPWRRVPRGVGSVCRRKFACLRGEVCRCR